MTASRHNRAPGDSVRSAVGGAGDTGRAPGAGGEAGAIRFSSATRAVRLGLLGAGAVAVYVFEGLFPMPLPWARLGLSNVVVVVALFSYGARFAFAVNAVRIVAGNLLVGTLLGPAFIFSALGSTLALAVMATVRWRLVPPFSAIGVSMLGAVANNAAQAAVFAVMFTDSPVAGRLLGAFVLLGLGVGCATGVLAARIIDKVGLARLGALG
jgi:heptaprenyl diphosphate synthase